jgi:hypothetical protein
MLVTSAMAGSSNEEALKRNLKKLAPAVASAGTVDYKTGCATCAQIGPKDEHALLVSKDNNQKIDLTIITEEEANAAFADIVARGDIPFEYIKDGCYSRAHKMALVLDDKGITSGKAFLEGQIYYDGKQGEVGWSYQVAPVVLVKKGGQVVPYVIDPSLFNKAVPVDEWKAKLTKKSKTKITREYYTNRFAYDIRDRDSKYNDYQEDQLNDMDDTNRNLMRALYVQERTSNQRR